MNKIKLIILCALFATAARAQDSLYVYYKNGTVNTVGLNKIQNIDFKTENLLEYMYVHKTDQTNLKVSVVDVLGYSFKQLAIDPDGYQYKTVQIGKQVWFAENLRTTKYNDGTAIPNVTDASAWAKEITGSQCDYENNPSNSEVYGKLYNWYAVNTGKLCPVGWHVPTKAEWKELATYLDGESVAGGKLKEIGFAHWYSPNTGATNEIGFTALPEGYRQYNFNGIGSYCWMWSSTKTLDNYYGEYIEMRYNMNFISFPHTDLITGMSVRCLKNY